MRPVIWAGRDSIGGCQEQVLDHLSVAGQLTIADTLQMKWRLNRSASGVGWGG